MGFPISPETPQQDTERVKSMKGWFIALMRILPKRRYLLNISQDNNALFPTKEAVMQGRLRLASEGKCGADALIVPVWISDVEVSCRGGGNV